MPLYEYLCRGCERQVELLVRSEEESLECPECGGNQLMKLLSVPAAPTNGDGSDGEGPTGPCGSACGCFPQG